MSSLRLARISPTAFLSGPESDLRQTIRVAVENGGLPAEAALEVRGPSGLLAADRVSVPEGESSHQLRIPAPRDATPVTVSLSVQGRESTTHEVTLQPPRKWTVHVSQRSHHDVGYTNLASVVLREHVQFLDEALDMADATADWPEESRFRLVIEQAWSLVEFLRRAPADRVAKMIALLREGRFELTALFGNMTSELCGHESLVRCLYPSARLAREHGFAITSAEHNDVPGMSWGLAEILAEAGIRIFCPALPRYWDWCQPSMQSFWDDGALFPKGRPGCFWWEAPSGRRVLLWDNFGAGSGPYASLPGLADRLQELSESEYPFNTVRWTVIGGARDNSPYIQDFCRTVRDWNAKWTYPRLMVSTNAMFYEELSHQLPDDLPVFRGELPGPDYPVGAASTAEATAANRANKTELLSAERLASLACAMTDLAYPGEALDEAYEDVLWHDEHTWGHHFPCGPGCRASQHEKAVHAHRAAAIAGNVGDTAVARIADHVRLPGDGFYIAVFNPLPWTRSIPVVTPMREFENCGSTMARLPANNSDGETFLRGVPLTDRWHAHPPPELVAGRFKLVDVVSRQAVDFQIAPVENACETVPFAPERVGLGRGGLRYGGMEHPSGLLSDLHFLARDLPACGYRVYELKPLTDMPEAATADDPARVIESDHYRLELDASGAIASLIDRETGRELLDPCAPHGLGDFVVRGPNDEGAIPAQFGPWTIERTGPVYSRLLRTGSAPGHPQISQTITLRTGIKRVELATRVLKDATPALDAHLAFPFRFEQPRFRYQGALSGLSLVEDFLPGAYWDTLAVQDWVCVSGADGAVVWSSLDAPLVCLGDLWPGYVSPAHSARVPSRAHHPPTALGEVRNGWVYSTLFTNNFGTNFSVSQTGSILFRHVFTSCAEAPEDGLAGRIGLEQMTPARTIFLERRREGRLPTSASLLELSGDPLVPLTLKPAEDGRGHILRLWNSAPRVADADIVVNFISLADAEPATITEGYAPEDPGSVFLVAPHRVQVTVPPRRLLTVRLLDT